MKNLRLRLKGNENRFGRGDAARTSKTVGQGDLSRGLILDGYLVFGRNFVKSLGISQHNFQSERNG